MDSNALQDSIGRERFGLGALLSAARVIYSERLRALLLVILIVYLPVNILLEIVPAQASIGDADPDGFLIEIINILVELVPLIATMAIAWLVEQTIRGEDSTYNEALRVSTSRLFDQIWTGLLGGLILIGLTLLLIVPGVIWLVYYSFALFVVVLRHLSGKPALDYSKSLVQGHWWRVLGVGVVIFTLKFSASFLVGIGYGLLITLIALPAAVQTILAVAFSTVIDIISAYFLIAHVLFFLNMDYLRTTPVWLKRKEPSLLQPVPTPALDFSDADGGVAGDEW